MKQFNDIFKMLLDVHQEYSQLLGDDERGRGDNWFDDVDIQVCSFKRKVLLAEESCSESQIMKVFIQEQQCI